MSKRNVFKDLNSALNSEWLWNCQEYSLNNQRLFRYTKYYDRLYQDMQRQLSGVSDGYHDFEKDLFTLLYTERSEKNPSADWIYRKIAGTMNKSNVFPSLKALCEGKEIFAAIGASYLFQKINDIIGDLLLNEQIEKYRSVVKELERKITIDVQYIKTERNAIKNAPPTKHSKFLKTLNCVFDRQKQRENLLDKLDELFFRYSQVTKELEMAIRDAEKEILELQNVLISWGNEAGQGSDISLNTKILDRVRKDAKLLEISQLLGKYKKMLIDKRKNSFTYGEGEKYDLTTGNDINTCLSADMALLSTPQTQPLFIHKFMNGGLTQYRKREAVAKAKGDIIVCVDGSGSMSGVIAWAMALALALQEIAAEDKRKFALIQFGDKDELRIDEFLPGLYTPEDVMDAASHFFDGGTNFERPLNEVMQLIEKGYHDAEVAFITDGRCKISDEFAKRFVEFREIHKLTITGILLDESNSNCGASLQPFCNRLYRTSTMNKNAIAEDLLKRIDSGDAA